MEIDLKKTHTHISIFYSKVKMQPNTASIQCDALGEQKLREKNSFYVQSVNLIHIVMSVRNFISTAIIV